MTALKHYTSKIQTYEDLESLGTFGFRGEALSSLCALSNLTITTRHSSSVCANRIEYDKSGLIKSKTQCARSTGSTVQLEKLFHTLPVRHKEFQKNLKREYSKLMHVIQCYCLISEGVKLSCFNTIGEKSTKIMSTHSKNNLKENVIEIFGLSTFNSLVKFEQSEPDEDLLAEFKLKALSSLKPCEEEKADVDSQDSQESMIEDCEKKAKTCQYSDKFKIEGFISNCSHNQGRSAPDRQYIYVNKRPCDHGKITKLINEVFHQFNRTQYPMFVLNINMDSNNVDVNVTPDKLQMFFKNENALLAVLKASMLKVYNRLFKNMNLNDSSFYSQKSSALMTSFFQPKPKTSRSLSEIGSDEEMDKNPNQNSKQKPKEISVITEMELITEKSKRYRDEDVFLSEEEHLSAKPKQPKLADLFEDSIIEKSPERRKGSPKSITNRLSPKPTSCTTPEKCSLPTTLTTKVMNRSPVGSKSPFSNKDRSLFFTNKIGSKPDQNPNITLNDSFAQRIDLHLCNRDSAALDTPPPAPPIKRVNLQENLKVLGLNNTQVDHDLAEIGLITQLNDNESMNSSEISIIAQGSTSYKESTRLESTSMIKHNEVQEPVSSQISSTLKVHLTNRKEKCLEINFNRFKKIIRK